MTINQDILLLYLKWNHINMLKAPKIASYLCSRYLHDFGTKIDEMKLHKLLYLTQRECLVQYDVPIFGEIFEAWKYGPVAPEIRYLYKENLLTEQLSDNELAPYKDAVDNVFELYANRNSWTLSSITHGEYAWQKAFSKTQGHLISTDDIRRDASRIRLRRFLKN